MFAVPKHIEHKTKNMKQVYRITNTASQGARSHISICRKLLKYANMVKAIIGGN